MSKLTKTLWVATTVTLFVFGSLFIYVFVKHKDTIPQEDVSHTSPGELMGGHFTLTSHTGEQKATQSFNSPFLLVYFGYTYCPDICPTALEGMTQALEKLPPEKLKNIQPIFVTVDPERDTVQTLQEYITSFHPNFVAYTGSPQEVEDAKKLFRVYAQKQENENMRDSCSYLIDHSSIIYLVDKDGKYVYHFSHNTDPQEMYAYLKSIL